MGSDTSILSTETNAIPLTQYPVSNYSGSVSTIKVRVRNSTTGADYSVFFNILTQREGGSATVVTSAVYAEIGTTGAVGIGSGLVANLAVTNIEDDGSGFDVEVTNEAANTIQVYLELV